MVSFTHPRRLLLRLSPLLTISWAVTLLISALPTILWQEFIGRVPDWLAWARLALLVTLIVLGNFWRTLRPLRPYFGIIFALFLAEFLLAWLGRTQQWQHWFGATTAPFIQQMLGIQLLRFGVTLIMLGALFTWQHQRSNFFLVTGRLDAPATPVRWLGMARPVSWTRFGFVLTLCISGGTLVFLMLAGPPSPQILLRTLPLLPVVFLLAAINAFSEEFNYRAALLAPLHGIVGSQHAMLLTAILFGLAHYYGVPYGIIGVVMASVLGWLLGKSMLETRGFFWAWFIHFWQDVLIFTFMAVGSVVAGGR